MKLRDVDTLTEAERAELAVASRAARPTRRQREEIAELIAAWRSLKRQPA